MIVDFQGAWTNEMKGAFDYACRICEEAMPTTFPIWIQAVLDKNKKTDTFSKVSISSHSLERGYICWYWCWQRIKWLCSCFNH